MSYTGMKIWTKDVWLIVKVELSLDGEFKSDEVCTVMVYPKSRCARLKSLKCFHSRFFASVWIQSFVILASWWGDLAQPERCA